MSKHEKKPLEISKGVMDIIVHNTFNGKVLQFANRSVEEIYNDEEDTPEKIKKDLLF